MDLYDIYMNPFSLAKNNDYDVCFLPNHFRSSTVDHMTKTITVGETFYDSEKSPFDFSFMVFCHEIGHLINFQGTDADYTVQAEIDAWKTAFKDFLTLQPYIRQKMYDYVQHFLNGYVQTLVYSDKEKIDHPW